MALVLFGAESQTLSRVGARSSSGFGKADTQGFEDVVVSVEGMEVHIKAVEGSCVRFGYGRDGGASVATVAQNLGVCSHFGATLRFSTAKYPLRRVNEALNGLKEW